MSDVRLISQIALADLRERSRRYSVLVTLGFMIYAGYFFLPANNSGYSTFAINEHRGIYNSAWTGTQVVLLTTVFLAFAGFFLVRNGIARDENTRVGQIIASTPVTKLQYLLGKWLSNFTFLGAMSLVVTISAGVTQIFRGEDTTIEPLKLFAPYFILAVPMLAVVASLALLFESIKFLRGGGGGVLYFFFWTFSLTPPSFALAKISKVFDFWGQSTAIEQIKAACAKVFSDVQPGEERIQFGVNFTQGKQLLTTFRWEGMDWTGELLLGRLLLFVVAFMLLYLASRCFNRFETEPSRLLGVTGKKAIAQPESIAAGTTEVNGSQTGGLVAGHLTPLPPSRVKARFFSLVFAETRLALQGVSRWWYIVALGLVIAGLLSPLEVSKGYLLPISWIWPLVIWSALGCRESINGTEELIFSTPHPLRQVGALWMAGVVCALATGCGVGIKLLFSGSGSEILAWFIGGAFISAFAISMGVISRGRRLFEVLYTCIWYMGPMNHLPALDFTGVTTAATTPGLSTSIWIVLTLIMMTAAFAGRAMQQRH